MKKTKTGNKTRVAGGMTLSGAAEQFGVNAKTLRQALLSANYTCGAGQRYSVREVYDALSGAGLLRTARAREAAARAEKMEFQLGETKGDLLSRARAEAYMTKILTPLREALNSMPSRLCGAVGAKDEQAARDALQRWVDATVAMACDVREDR